MKEYRDHYFLKARQENYPARSIYKLREIDKRFKLFKSGMRVLDLGAAPGSWSIGAAEKIGSEGLVIACDIQTVDTVFPPQVVYFQSDIYAPSPEFARALTDNSPFNIVLSDMAPKTSGTKFSDQARSLELCLAAFDLAHTHLIRGGAFVVKVFMGPDIHELLGRMRQSFGLVKSFKPDSSRKESKETFFIGQNFLGALDGRT
jgi:23S rRNA (uridine2552-2'-O)-methyltransferase